MTGAHVRCCVSHQLYAVRSIHRQFVYFVLDVDCGYKNVTYYTEIRRLSRHIVLKIFYYMISDVIVVWK
jgi:hypothetical protein